MARLQGALQELGYDVGDVDGVFGYLTWDALCQFQREHRLTVDGRAGAQVWATLFRPELRAMREVHVVARGERLSDIARKYGVSERFLQRTNRLTRRYGLHEGRRLILRSRYVIGALDSLAGERDTAFVLRRVGRHLSAVANLEFRLRLQGEVEGEWHEACLAVCREHGVEALAVLHASDADGPPDAVLHRLLHNRKMREACTARCRELVRRPEVGGLIVDLPGLRLGSGSRFVRFVFGLGKELRARGKRLIVGVPLPFPGMRGRLQLADIDWPRLAEITDGILLQTHRPLPGADVPPTPEQLRKGIKALCTKAPRWKVLLGIPIGAREWRAHGEPLTDLTYQQAIALAYGRGRKPSWDEALGLHVASYLPTEPDAVDRTLWLYSAQAVVQYLQLVEAYDLQGAFFWRVNGEDGRLWRELPHWFKVYRHADGERGI